MYNSNSKSLSIGKLVLMKTQLLLQGNSTVTMLKLVNLLIMFLLIIKGNRRNETNTYSKDETVIAPNWIAQK